jgi:hypothetical protein
VKDVAISLGITWNGQEKAIPTQTTGERMQQFGEKTKKKKKKRMRGKYFSVERESVVNDVVSREREREEKERCIWT